MKYKLINVKKQWPKFQEYLHEPLVEAALKAGMDNFCADHAYSNKKVFDANKGPWYYTNSDYWCDRKRPEKDTLEWYNCVGACHWMAGFACALGMFVYPKYDWFIMYSQKHSVAAGYYGKTDTLYILDILNARTLKQIEKDIDLVNGKWTTLGKEIVLRREHFRNK